MSSTLQSWLGKKMRVRAHKPKGIQYEDASWDTKEKKHQPWRKIVRMKAAPANDFVYQRAKARREERAAVKKMNEVIFNQKRATGKKFYDPRLDENGNPIEGHPLNED